MVVRSEMSIQNLWRSFHFTEAGSKFSSKLSSSQCLEWNIISYTTVGVHFYKSSWHFSNNSPTSWPQGELRSAVSGSPVSLRPLLAGLLFLPHYVPHCSGAILHIHCCLHTFLNLPFCKSSAPLVFLQPLVTSPPPLKTLASVSHSSITHLRISWVPLDQNGCPPIT